jgi:hypothetical protein
MSTINAINAQPIKGFDQSRQKTSFGEAPAYVVVKQQEHKDSFVKRAAANFVSGAVIATLLDVGKNALSKQPKMPAKAILIGATITGACFVVIDTVFALVGKLLNR